MFEMEDAKRTACNNGMVHLLVADVHISITLCFLHSELHVAAPQACLCVLPGAWSCQCGCRLPIVLAWSTGYPVSGITLISFISTD